MERTISKFERQLCSVQGRMFELSAKRHYESKAFVEDFMNSRAAAYFDLPYDRTQWLGEENLLQDLIDENPSLKNGETYSNEALFWMGYLYRYWHFLTGESSREIFSQCNGEEMNGIYPAYHTLDCCMAIERIKEAKKN